MTALTPRPRLLLLITAILSLLACSCGPGGGRADELLIASPHRDETREELERAFASWYRERYDREVLTVWLDMGGSSNIQKTLSDRLSSAATAGVDIFFGGGTDPYESLKRQGNLVAYQLPAAILDSIPADLHGMALYDPDHTWYGVVIGTFGIMYNRDVLRRTDLPEPSTWEDLGSPLYAGNGGNWIGAADPRHSSSVHVIYENILQAYGWDKGYEVLTRMSANSTEFVRESSSVPRQVQIGEVACAPVIDLYAFSLIAREGPDRIGFALPEGLTVITPDAAAIVRGAPNLPVAQAFMQFLLSEEGQRLWMLRRGVPGGPVRYDLSRPSILPHLYQLPAHQIAVNVNPFQTKAALRYDGRVASRRWNALNDLIGATLIDSQVELRRAWTAVLRVSPNDDLIEALTRPPCDESELIALAEIVRQSPHQRTVTINEWMAEARQRYRAVAKDAERRNAS